MWHSVNPRAVSLHLGWQSPKKRHLHFQIIAENSKYPKKNCRKGAEPSLLDYLEILQAFMLAISFNPHDNPIIQNLLSPLSR